MGMAGGAGGVIRAGQEVILGVEAGEEGAGVTGRGAGVKAIAKATGRKAVLRAGVTVGVGAEVGVGVRAGVKAGVGVRAKVGVGAEKRKRKVRRRFKVLLLRRSRKKLRSLPKTKVCHLL